MSPTPAPRILQVGTYSSWNKGDAAMQIATATAVKEKWPGARVTISSPFPEKDGPFYEGVAAVIRCRRRRLIYASFQILRAGLWRLGRKILGRYADRLLLDRELRATLDADLVIDLSGDMLTDDYGPHVAYSHYIPIINALLLDRPVFICAQSIGPFRWTGWLAKRIFKRVGAITVRDEISLQHLKDIGLDLSNTTLTADMAFLLNPVSEDRVNEILSKEDIAFGDRSVLGVSLSRILQQRYETANSADSFVHLIAGVLDNFIATSNMDVLFVPHVTGPSESKDDRRIGAEVAAAMKVPSNVIQGDYRPEELKGLIARCSLFMGARMHANIGALSSGVPVVAMSYSHKTLGIMSLFGQQGHVIAGEKLSAQSLKELLIGVDLQKQNVNATLKSTIRDIRESAAKNLDVAESIMSRSKMDTQQ